MASPIAPLQPHSQARCYGRPRLGPGVGVCEAGIFDAARSGKSPSHCFRPNSAFTGYGCLGLPEATANATELTDGRRCGAYPREVISVSCHCFMLVVALLGVIGVAACTRRFEECTVADAAEQYAQSLPERRRRGMSGRICPDANAPALRPFTRICSPAGQWRMARAWIRTPTMPRAGRCHSGQRPR